MSTTKFYGEIVDFIAAGTTPEGRMAFRLGESARRGAELITKIKEQEHVHGRAVRTRRLLLTRTHSYSAPRPAPVSIRNLASEYVGRSRHSLRGVPPSLRLLSPAHNQAMHVEA